VEQDVTQKKVEVDATGKEKVLEVNKSTEKKELPAAPEAEEKPAEKKKLPALKKPATKPAETPADKK
jgi:hypothetical protein